MTAIPTPIEVPVVATVERATMSARGQSMLITAARVLAALFATIIPLVLVRVLDQSAFGRYKQLFLVADTAIPILAIAIPGSLYYLVPRSPANRHRLFAQSLLMLAVLGLVGAVGLLVGGPLANRMLGVSAGKELGLLALFVAMAVPASLLFTAPMVDRRARLAASMVAGFDVLRGVVLATVAVVTRDLHSVVLAAVVVMALQLLGAVTYLIWGAKGESWRPDRMLLGAQLHYALPFAGTAMIGLARDRAHAYYVAIAFTDAQFAIYAAATMSIPFIGYLSQTVGEIVILENSANFAAGRIAEMQRVWHRASYALALLLLPVAVLAEIYAGDAIVLLYGADYAAATSLLRLYLLVLPLSALLASPMLRASGDMRVMLGADAVSLAVALGVLVVLAPTLGLGAAVCSLLAGNLAFICVASRRTAERLGLGFRNLLPWKRLAAVVAVSAAAGLIPALLLSGLAPIPRLLIGGPMSVLAVGAALWVAGLVPDSERALLIAQLQRLRRALGRGPLAGRGDG